MASQSFSRKLKIGLVVDDTIDKPDGVQQYVLALGKWFTEQGHEVHYIVGESHRADLPNVHSIARNVAVTFNGNRLTIPLPVPRRKIRNLLDQLNLDVIHVQSPHSPFMAQRVILEAAPTMPVVATFHILPYSWAANSGMYVLAWLLRPSLRRINIMFAVTAGAQEFIRKTCRLQTPILPNTLALRPFQQAKGYERYADKLTIVYLNRLVPRKGAMQLVRAISYIRDHRLYDEPFRVVICGKGEETEPLQLYIEEEQLNDVITLEGFVSEANKPRFLASADIAVYPSTGGESFGIVLLEGMAASKGAVLAGDNPGYACVMQPHPEQLFNPVDIPAFAEKLANYMAHPEARAQARKWQAQHVKQYDVNKIGQQLLDAYTELLAR